MGSTEPPPTPARTGAHELHPELKRCAECGLPYEDGPLGSGTAGCPGCDPTLRLRALARAARRARRGSRGEPLEQAA
jgi:uncharacterized paraquat-inducible protein A